MKFLVGKSRKEAVQFVRTELLWEQIGPYKLLDLYRDEVQVICRASELRGVNVETVYLAYGFDSLDVVRWEEFQHAFAARKLRTMRI